MVIKPELLRGIIAEFDIKIGKDLIVEQGRRITAKHIKQLQAAKVDSINAPLEYLIGKVISSDIVDTDTGEILLEANTLISEESLEVLTATKEMFTLHTMADCVQLRLLRVLILD